MQKMSRENTQIEVIDLLSIQPWIEILFQNQLKKLIALLYCIANLTGVGAEISFVNENLFEFLDAPVLRVASLIRQFLSSNLEKEIYFPINRIEDKIRYILEY